MRKLNSRGVAHHFLLMLIVVSVALGGVYRIVASHADSLNANNGSIAYGGGFISSDGKSITATSSNAYSLYNLSLDYSPDGTQIVYSQHTGGVYTAMSDGSNPKNIIDTSQTPGTNYEPVQWSPDGNSIVAVAQGTADNGSYKYSTYKLVVANPDGTNLRDIPNLDPTLLITGVSWLPDSSTVAYSTRTDLCTVKIDGSNNSCHSLEAVIPNTSGYTGAGDGNILDARLSPDGTKALVRVWSKSYTDTTGGMHSQLDLYQVDIDGTNPIEVTNLPALTADNYNQPFVQPTALWAPDSKSFIYTFSTSGLQDRGQSLYQRSVADGSTTTLRSGSYDLVAWQPVVPGKPASALPSDTVQATCSINLPATMAPGTTVQPTVSIHNISQNMLYGPVHLTSTVMSPLTGASQIISDSDVSFAPAAVAGLTSASFPSFVMPFAGNPGDVYTASVVSHNFGMSCASVSRSLPVLTATLSGATSYVADYLSTSTVTGTTGPGSSVSLWTKAPTATAYTQHPAVKADTAGHYTTTLVANNDYAYYAQSSCCSLTKTIAVAKSGTVSIKVRPTSIHATTLKVNKGSTVNFGGRYLPNTNVTLHLHRSSDAAGSYPIVRTVKSDASGNYSYSMVVSQYYAYYEQGPNGANTAVHTVSIY